MPTIAAKTAETEKVAVPPIAYCRTNPAAAAGTEIMPAINAATGIEDLFLGKIFLTSRNAP